VQRARERAGLDDPHVAGVARRRARGRGRAGSTGRAAVTRSHSGAIARRSGSGRRSSGAASEGVAPAASGSWVLRDLRAGGRAATCGSVRACGSTWRSAGSGQSVRWISTWRVRPWATTASQGPEIWRWTRTWARGSGPRWARSHGSASDSVMLARARRTAARSTAVGDRGAEAGGGGVLAVLVEQGGAHDDRAALEELCNCRPAIGVLVVRRYPRGRRIRGRAGRRGGGRAARRSSARVVAGGQGARAHSNRRGLVVTGRTRVVHGADARGGSAAGAAARRVVVACAQDARGDRVRARCAVGARGRGAHAGGGAGLGGGGTTGRSRRWWCCRCWGPVMSAEDVGGFAGRVVPGGLVIELGHPPTVRPWHVWRWLRAGQAAADGRGAARRRRGWGSGCTRWSSGPRWTCRGCW
jgi:hypothetical protein